MWIAESWLTRCSTELSSVWIEELWSPRMKGSNMDQSGHYQRYTSESSKVSPQKCNGSISALQRAVGL